MRHLHLAALGAAAAVVCAAPAQAALVDLTTMQLNGVSSLENANATLRLNYGSNLQDPMDPGSNQGQASSAFISTAFSSSSTFTTSFTFTLTNTGFSPQGDGITFMVQNHADGASALGGTGGDIGAGGLNKNVGVGFQSWDNDHATIFTDGDVFGGSAPLFAIPGDFNSAKTPNFFLGQNAVNVVNVSVVYDGTVLSYIAQNTSTMQSISDSLAFDLTSLGSEVYFGFTGATGLSYAVQDIDNWDLSVNAVQPPVVGGVPEPAAWALMLTGFFGLGGALRRRRALTA